MSTLLLVLLVVAVVGVAYWAYTNLVGDKTLKQAADEITFGAAVAEAKADVAKVLDVNNDGKVNVEDVKEAGKKVKAGVKKAATKAKAAKITAKKTKK